MKTIAPLAAIHHLTLDIDAASHDSEVIFPQDRLRPLKIVCSCGIPSACFRHAFASSTTKHPEEMPHPCASHAGEVPQTMPRIPIKQSLSITSS